MPLEMLYYQLPMYFFLGTLLYVFPKVTKILALTYLALVVFNIMRSRDW